MNTQIRNPPRCWLLLFSTIPVFSFARADEPRPIEHARFDEYCEGPVFDYDGNLFVSHGKSSVAKITPAGRVTRWLEAENPNGHKVLPDGTHLLCIRDAVLHLAADASILRRASTQCNGAELRAPNDITLSPRGGFYFTDPGGSRTAPIGTIHYVDTKWNTQLAANGLWVPNGLDGRKLYVAETVPNRILWFDVKPGGMLGEINVFARLPSKPGAQAEPDGLAVDTRGNLYVAHLGMSSVQILSPDANLLLTLAAGNYDASNLVFGGPRMDRLYVTGSSGHRSNSPGRVYRLDLPGVAGAASLLPRKK